MKRSLILVSALALLFAASVKAQKLPVAGKHAFCLWNVNAGKPEQVQLFDGQQKLQVLVFLSPECPLCKNYSVSLNALQKKYAATVQVTGIVAGKAYSAAEVKEYIEKYKISFKVYLDTIRSVSGLLHASVTPEVFLLNPGQPVLYHGAIDNWVKELGMASSGPTRFYLRDAIDQALAGKPVNLSFVKPVGCLINDY